MHRAGDVYWPTAGWRTCTPELQGMDSALLAAMLRRIAEERLPIDSVLVIRGGYIVTEAYVHPFTAGHRHRLYSATKSFTSALVGIAIDHGYVRGVQDKMVGLLAGRTFGSPDERKSAVTLEHLLTMNSGFAFPGDELANPVTGHMMKASPDWVQFILDLPMAEAPGTRFNYNDCVSHTISAIIQARTGRNAYSFAKEHLFDPLGFSDVWWPADPQGVNYGWGDAHMTPRDMARLGYLYLREGMWDGKQIVSTDWIRVSTSEQIRTAGANAHGLTYGYHWWVHRPDFFTAIGRAGQFILGMPEMDLVVVFTCDLGDDDIQIPIELLYTYIVPSVVSSTALSDNTNGEALLTSWARRLSNPVAQRVPAQPPRAAQVSGRVYALDANPLGWETLSLTCDGTRAVFSLRDGDGLNEWEVGLDGVFRVSPVASAALKKLLALTDECDAALRGFWRSGTTFQVDWRFVGNRRQVMALTFQPDRLSLWIQDITHGRGKTGRIMGSARE